VSYASQADPLLPQCLPLLLIVDDDPEIRYLYSVLLKKYFRLIGAEDGEAGLTRALEVTPDLILTDQNMPVCTGVEMVQRMHQIPALQQVPIVVSSGYMNAELEKQFAALGVRHFLDKPCRGEDLVKILSMHLTKGSPRAQARGLAPSAIRQARA
jgi:CheY-like chemotaxis protein